jgi:hypothetical protein
MSRRSGDFEQDLMERRKFSKNSAVPIDMANWNSAAFSTIAVFRARDFAFRNSQAVFMYESLPIYEAQIYALD